MMSKKEILIKLRELKPSLQRNYVVKEIGLFGSVADDSCNENSDSNLFVELEEPNGWKFFTLEIYLEKMISPKRKNHNRIPIETNPMHSPTLQFLELAYIIML